MPSCSVAAVRFAPQFAQELASDGAEIFLAGRTGHVSERFAKQIKEATGRVHAHLVDALDAAPTTRSPHHQLRCVRTRPRSSRILSFTRWSLARHAAFQERELDLLLADAETAPGQRLSVATADKAGQSNPPIGIPTASRSFHRRLTASTSRRILDAGCAEHLCESSRNKTDPVRPSRRPRFVVVRVGTSALWGEDGAAAYVAGVEVVDG